MSLGAWRYIADETARYKARPPFEQRGGRGVSSSPDYCIGIHRRLWNFRRRTPFPRTQIGQAVITAASISTVTLRLAVKPAAGSVPGAAVPRMDLR
jgi:hypothetical protein